MSSKQERLEAALAFLKDCEARRKTLRRLSSDRFVLQALAVAAGTQYANTPTTQYAENETV